jgi:hypothetical protein
VRVVIRSFIVLAVLLTVLALFRPWRDGARQAELPATAPTESAISAPSVEPVEAIVERSSAPEAGPVRTEPNIMALITRQPMPDIEVPSWADDMESTILSYVAQQPNLALTGLQVQCANEGCLLLMIGTGIRVYDMNFDVFADEHGFNGALVGGDSRARTVFLRRSSTAIPR